MDFLKNNRTDNPQKEGVVKRNNPFATTINWAFHYRKRRPISLVQLRLLQGSQEKSHSQKRMAFFSEIRSCGTSEIRWRV